MSASWKVTVEYHGGVFVVTFPRQEGETEESIANDVLEYAQVYVEAVEA